MRKKLHNPSGFREKIMADVPELDVDADLPALLRGETHLRELRLDFREFRVDIDEEYSNIHDTTGLASLIVTRALVKTTVADLANFDLKALQGTVNRAGKVGAGVLGTAGQKAADTAEALKKLWPLGQEEGQK